MNKTLTCCVALLALLGLAGASLATPSIDAESFGDGFVLHTDFTFGKAWLRVIGPNGYVAELEAGSLEELTFSLDAGAEDGRYRWELLAVEPGAPALRDRKSAELEGARHADQPRTASFSGSFRVEGGIVKLPQAAPLGDRDEALKTEVIADNLIVQGNECVGMDCTASEAFGSDVLRLKDNIVQISFEDTSSSSDFPSNDWRLKANDSTDDGDDYFSIVDATAGNTPFRIEAGAGRAALWVVEGGDVGLGTVAPTAKLHLKQGNTPTVRLQQDGSNGFDPQTWDVAGNETNFFVQDVSHGSKIPFKIFPKAPTDSFVIAETGDVGINEKTPGARLHVRDGGSAHTPTNSAVMTVFQRNANTGDGAIVSILSGTEGNAQIFFGDKDVENMGRVVYRNTSDAMSFWTAGAERMFIESDGDICIGCNDAQGNAIRHANGAVLTAGGTWTNASSRSLKQDITELSGEAALAALRGLSPVTFRYKAEPQESYVGFVAEDVPQLVAMNDRKSLTAMDVVAVLTKVVQAQQDAYAEQAAVLEAQRLALETLSRRVQAFEDLD